MTIRRTRSDLFRSKKIRQRKCAEARREAIRQLRVEPLEQRRLLAGLELVGVQPDGRDFIEDGDVRDFPPTALRFVFVGNQQIDPSTLGGIQVTRAGKDGQFGDASDVVIQPGYIGLGAAPNEVMLRFVNTLPDDLYRIDIIGSGVDALKNTDGDAFNNGVDQRIQFRLDLGPQVVAVVPQPISQQPNGSLAQARNQIDVYFNNDDLHLADAQNPALYQLIFTRDTATNRDDVMFNPVSVVYQAPTDKAVLTFADELHKLIDPATTLPVGEGTFRLRIGTSEALPLAPLRVEPVGDVGSSFATARNLGTLDVRSQLVASAVDPQPFVLDFPGSNDEPGHREIPEEVAGGYDNHLNPAFGEDNTSGITTILYNFKSDYGRDPGGQPLVNLITEGQKTLARQALEMWSRYIGVQFLETTDKGMTIVTGDPRALDPYASDVVNHALDKPLVDANFIAKVDPAYQDSMLILDNANQWQDSFGGDWFKTALTGIGFMLGLERATDLPSSTLMAFGSAHTYPGATTPEPIFLGNHDILHGSVLHRPDSVDIDMYRFQVATGQEGVFTAETFAERQPNSSLLDSYLTLYRENADGSREVIARNDNYYSEDSYVELRLGAGTYYLGVTAAGNTAYNPEFVNTGFGGKSQGPYDLRVEFRADSSGANVMQDDRAGQPGTALDGDADGVPGGIYNFWFRAVDLSHTVLVDKANRAFEAGARGKFTSIADALNPAKPGSAQPGDIVRIVGNSGTDGLPLTLDNNFAYEIGAGALPGQVLADGTTLNVPKGVTVMVDEGAIFKLNKSRIGVGSSSLGVDRSAGAFQVLGTPNQPVYFTSYWDETIGLDTHLPKTTPRPGDWGGLVYRNDLDNAEQRFNYEREGIFLNYVNHADMRYGGGNVVIDSIRQIVTPVQMLEARPTVSFNKIRLSADAPLSADPDSFEETNFHAPKFQLKGSFTSDYRRVGPDIHGNLLVENSTNGMFVRITTPAGNVQKQLTVAGRFDDVDVVHVLSENLRIQGTPGDPILELNRPPVSVVTLEARPGGAMEAGNYRYKIINVDTNGFEGRPSEATSVVAVGGANGSVRLDNLPPASGDFVARRLYRSVSGVAGPYVFVAQINASDKVYVDTASLASLDQNNTLKRDVPTVQGVTVTPLPGAGSAQILSGTYNYRITYVNSTTGLVSPASDVTVNAVLALAGEIQLNNLVPPNTNGYDRVRIYRSTRDGDAPYMLAGEILASETSFLDTGAVSSDVLSPESFGVARARMDARLAIDPGVVVKLEGSRIEVTFGAQLLAEGIAGREVIFTSRADDRYGAGGTFDTNGDGSQQAPKRGDWGGIYVGHLGSASIDHALLTFGGGVTKIEGTFKAFNILEIHQADARVANSVIEENDNGMAGQGPADRFGRGYNEPATIYVRGAQPILVNNTIQNNREVAVSINANSFTSDFLPDLGRSIGALEDTDDFVTNVGPLVRGNRMINNPLNAIDIRGEVLTTMSVWDDTDIVHVLRGEQVIVPDFHTNVGLRLLSSPSSSLVVKLQGPGDNFDPYLGAGFTATGLPLEISDRIGGSLQIVGQPDFPVVLTSLRDDTIGAGLMPNGETLLDTNNDSLASLPRAGDWRSVRLEQYANDRNVELTLESEARTATAPGENASPATAQFLGELAPFEQGGDENLRLGFDLHALLNEPNDIDVYSFNATAGTEVWLDIDRTTNTLNSVVELLDSNGVVVARSDNSLAETANPNLLYYDPAAIAKNDVNPLQRADDAFQPKHASGAPKDFYSLNTLDAGMRIVLPGVVGTRSSYYVRVRSSSNDLNNLDGGLTTGAYDLQVRLRETDEVPGCTVRYADIRYATNGVEAYGLPGHSPLLGESAEDEQVGGPDNNSLFPTPLGPMLNNYNPATGPQDLGNLMATDRGVLSVAGVLVDKNDFDLYEVQVGYDKVGAKTVSHVSVVFDMDYADGLARPNTTLTVFDSTGRPILVGTNSNIADDRPAPLSVNGDMSDLSRGSVGKLDPFIGPVSLPIGTYYVAVTSDNWLPDEVVNNSDVRRVPLNSIMRLTEDHFGGGTDFVSSVFGAIFDFDSIVNPGGDNYWDINADLGPPPGDGFLQTFDDSHGNNPRSFEAEPNDTIPTAQDLELELWTVGFDSNIENDVVDRSTTFPHVSVIDGKGNNTRDYYSFMVEVPGSQGIFDLDIDWDEILDPVDVMDGSMRLWDEWGTLLATSLDAGLDDGSPLPTDPMIQFAFQNAGRYIIEVTRQHPNPFNLYYPPQTGDNYTLHVSIQNHQDEFTPTRVYAHEKEPNDSFTQRQDLNSEIWSLNADPNITQAVLIPHVTVIDGSGDGTRDIYSFRVPRLPTDPFDMQRRAIIDIDATVGMNASLRVFERQGFNYVEVSGARSLENGLDPGSPLLTDPLIDMLFDAGRRYYIEVARQQPGNDFAFPAVGDQYVLHVSLVDQPVGANVNFHHVDTINDNVIYATNTDNPTTAGFNPNYPLYPPITIYSATPDFCLTTGSAVTVSGVAGNTNANNDPAGSTWSAIYVSPGVFQLSGRTANSAYTGGGVWSYTGNVIPGNSYGQVISKTFSLKGYTPEDRPVLYFSYFIDVLESLNEHQFNVYILAPDAGGNFQRVSRIASKGTNLLNIAEWRQARVDLAQFAGRDLQLEFEFAAVTPCTWTLYEGVAVDDIIIGFAERGEIIVYADSNPTFAPDLFASGTGTLHGPYQLEIRQASQTGESQRPTPEDSISHVANRFFDTNDRLVAATTLKALAGSAIVDGQFFTISDGHNSLTFEYNSSGSVVDGRVAVPFTAADLPEKVALSIRDAVNSPAAQSILRVTAGLSEGTNSGPNTYNAYLVNLYGNAIVQSSAAGFIVHHDAFGDSNVFRDQGQLLIHSNFITDARDFGIIVDAGPRDAEQDVPVGFLQTHVGSARNLRELNNQPDGGLVPGALIENNVIAGEGLGGVHVSGNFAPFEIVPPPDGALLSGEQVCDGNTITIHGYRTTVTFEFEDISGGNLPCGSGVQGGNGWREGNIPIFYRQSNRSWLYPPRSMPPYAYTQDQMATTIRDAIQSSILVTNGTTMHLDTDIFWSRWLRDPLTLAPLVATYVDHASTVTSSTSAIRIRRVPVGSAAQPFHRVLNNTVYGNDGQRSFFPGTGLDESNDTMGNAVETHQGRQHHPESYITNGVIGDGVELLNDVSLDVDFYRLQLEVGERVTVDIDAAPLSTLDSYLRLFDAQGNEVALSDNGMAPGETGSTDSFIDFTATKAGPYYVGVSGKGNEQYDPLSLGSRTGPASAGVYQIDVNVIAPRTWVITAQDGTSIPDGTTFTVSDIYRTVTYEFDDANAPGLTNPANIAIPYDSSGIGTNNRGPGYRAPDMAVAMANVIGRGLTGVTAVALGGYQGRSGNLPNQQPCIDGDTCYYGYRGFGHNTPLTPVNSASELYVVVSGASSIKGSIRLQPMLNENVDQLLPETGILVSERASPTILNNVLANLNAGVWQDSSPTTVVGASLFQHNDRADSNVGSAGDDFNITMGDYDPLFVNAANGEFYPAPLSRAIDSAIDSLEDRTRFVTVKNAMGIPVSPILAPDLDAVGLLRSDDPEVETPAGQGANVFKDRGALDRADFVGPDAVLIIPRDNDAAGVDLDPTRTVVQLAAGRYDKFEIQLVDGLQSAESGEGVGVDDTTVDSSKVTVTADGKLLHEDIDYTFRYNATTNTIILTPLAGAWEDNRAYVITLPNQDQFVIQMPNGTQVQDSETFVITDLAGGAVTFEFESGFSLFVPQTLTLVVPAVGKGPGGIQDGQRFVVRAGFLGQYRFEYDENTPPNYLPGNIPINIANISTMDDLALATVQALNNANIGVTARNLGNGQIHVGASAFYTLDTSLSTLTQFGNPGVVANGDTIIISDGISPPVRFEFTRTGLVNPGNVPIVVSNANTQDEIAQAIADAIDGSSVDMSPTNFGAGHVHLGGNPGHALNIAGSPNLTYTGQPGVRTSTQLIVPPQAAGSGGIADGQWFSIQNGNNPAVVFEWDSNGTTMPGSRPLLFTLTSTIDQLSSTMISAINLAGVGLTPQYLGAGVIALHDTIYHKTDTLQTTVSQIGVPGGVVQIDFKPDASFTEEDFAPLILDAIDNSLLIGVNLRFRGGETYYVEGVKSISGLQNFFIDAIEDYAGNNLQPNQASNQTRFTILMPGVTFDFGDAPASFGTLFADNGARHVVPPEDPLSLGANVTTENNGLPSPGANADTDDGVDLSLSVFNEHLVTPIVVHASGRGFLDAWIDYNRDGDWNDAGEQIFVSQQLVPGANNLSVQVPANSPTGDTYARFRLSRIGSLPPTGVATDGEVEDYLIRIEPGTPPVAVDDTGFSTSEDAALPISPTSLLANDTDVDSPHGNLAVRRFDAISANGATVALVGVDIVYDPTASPQLQALNPGEELLDTFTYQITDGVLPSNDATVTIRVTGVNDAPVAVDDTYATNEDTALPIGALTGVLANDTDVDLGDTRSVTAYDPLSTKGATVVVNANGSFFYDPSGSADLQGLAAGDTEFDTFTYTIRDSRGATATATVTVTVTGINDAPTAEDDQFIGNEDDVLAIPAAGVLANDTDVDGDAISAIPASTTSLLGAPVTVNADGSFTYDPRSVNVLQNLAVGQFRNDTFTYTIRDVLGVTNTATVTIRVDGRNDAPVATDDGVYQTLEDQLLTVPANGVLANDTDRDTGTVLTVDVANSDTVSVKAAVVSLSANGGFTYDPRGSAQLRALAPGAVATDTFMYTVTDGNGGTDTAIVTVRVTGVNSAPVATNKTFNSDEDTLFTRPAPGVLAGDSDPDGQGIVLVSYNAVSTLGAPVVVNMTDGSFSYNPTGVAAIQALNVGGSVTDTFTYTIRDTFAVPRTATATISMVVAGVNDVPVAANDSAQVPRNGSVTIPVLGNDQDVDSVLNVSSVLVRSGPSNGTAVPLADGRIQYTPTAGFFGTDVFKYTVADAQGAVSNEATVTVRVNAPPVADNDSVQTFRDVPININVLDGDTDPDGTLVPGTVTIIVRPTRGTAVPQANGTVTYTPGFGFIGTDSFTYTVKDNDGATSNEASVTVGVIVDPFPWRNPRNPLDVNDDGSVTPIDALLIINSLNFDGARPLPNPPIPPLVPPPYYDTSGDNRIDPIDALLVINYLNSGQGGEGEWAGDAASVAFGELLAAPFATSGRVTTAVLPSDDDVATGSAQGVPALNGDPLVGDPAGGWLTAWDGYAPSSSLDEALEQIADDITAAQDDDVLEDLAVSELLFGRRGRG